MRHSWILVVWLCACAGSPGGGVVAPDAPPACVTASDGPASGQTRARVGAYYFDGWTGPLSNFHFNGLVGGAYADRQPLSGWLDGSACAVEQQLAWAHRFGLSFFVFDWFFGAPDVSGGENLNSALQIARDLPDRHGMGFAILYVNSDPFIVGPADWSRAVAEWIGYMTSPGYVLVSGKPLFVVINMRQMRQTFGSPAAVAAAFEELRAAARAKGLPGVYVAGVMPTTDGAPEEDGLFPDLSSATADGYDAVTLYGYAFSTPLGLSGALPYSDLAAVGAWFSSQAASKSPLPFIPVVQTGWDARPWQENEPGRPEFWFTRAAGDVASAVNDAIAAAESAPAVRAEPAPAPPLVLLEAWNELGEGSFIAPTHGEGTGVGDALAATLATPSTRARTSLTVTGSGAGASRVVDGKLVDASGAAIAGAAVTVGAIPADGVVADVHLSGTAPATAVSAVLGFRVNTDDPAATWPGNWSAGPRPADFSLYKVSYVAGGAERVPNGDFSSGIGTWMPRGQAELAASDVGPGNRISVHASADELAALDSAPFPIIGGAKYDVTFTARIPAAARNGGYFVLAFRDSVDYLQAPGPSPGTPHSESIPLMPGRVELGTATTDGQGNYHLAVPSLAGGAVIDASYAGDGGHWPAAASLPPPP